MASVGADIEGQCVLSPSLLSTGGGTEARRRQFGAERSGPWGVLSEGGSLPSVWALAEWKVSADLSRNVPPISVLVTCCLGGPS